MTRRDFGGVRVEYDSWGRCCFTIDGTRYRGERRGIHKDRLRWIVRTPSGEIIGEGAVPAIIREIKACRSSVLSEPTSSS